MSMLNLSMCGTFVAAELGYVVETAAPKAGLRNTGPIVTRPRVDWAAGATTAWAGDRAVATVETLQGANAFSAHQVSRKPGGLPREVPCLT
jgi:hypothetical protein